MKVMGSLIVTAASLVLVASAPCEEVKTPSVQSDFEHVDTEGLRKAFAEAVKGSFDVVGDRLALYHKYFPHWLVSVRPKKAGFFVIRYDCKYEMPKSAMAWHRERASRASFEYRLTIGRKGDSRIHDISGRGIGTYPVACVGDTIIVPINVHKIAAQHAFSMHSFDEEEAAITAESNAKLAESAAPPDGKEYELKMPDDLKRNLELVRTRAGGGLTRKKDCYYVRQHACFRAKGPGRFNLSIDLTGEEKADPALDMRRLARSSADQTLPLVIVPADSAVTVLATGAHVRQYRGETSSEHRERHLFEFPKIRVGDTIVIDCQHYYTYVDEDNLGDIDYPTIRSEKLPFKPKEGPFDGR